MVEDNDSTAGAKEPPELGDIVNMEIEDTDEQRWIVLFEEDYENVLIDADDSVAILVDNNQACEVMRLASKVIGALAPAYAPDKEPIQAMIDVLQETVEGQESDS